MASPEYEAGTGGKFRKRPFRRPQATPYDRPASAARGGLRGAAAGSGSGGWLSKLVDPASRFITDGASRIFDSFFRKRLAAPQAAPEENHQSRQEVREVAYTNPSSELLDGSGSGGDKPKNNSNIDGVSELEELLKKKTFTWVESEHLTELLRSRTVEPVTLEPTVNNEIKEENAPAQEDVEGQSRLYETPPNPTPSLTTPENEAASPTELAKTYVDSRHLAVSSLTLRRRSQAFQEDAFLPSIVPYASTPINRSVASRPFIPSGAHLFPENGFQAPKTQGRSAMCRMISSPYFKVQSTANTKVLKRGSSVLDSDVGTFGPIRRIRQRSSLMPSKAYPSTLLIKDADGGSTSVHKRSRLDEPKYQNIDFQDAENKASKTYVNVTPIPAKSSETAMKILQQLDKLVPSPKKKSSERKATAGNESSSRLAHIVSAGEALKSLEDSAEFFTIPGSSSLDPNKNSHLPCHGTPLSDADTLPSEENSDIKIGAFKDPSVLNNDSLKARDSSGSLFLKVDNIEPKLLTYKSAVSETTLGKKYLWSSPKTMTGSSSLLSREAEIKASVSLSISEKDSGLTLTAAPSSVSHNISALQNERAAPFFNFASKAARAVTSSSTTNFSCSASQKNVASEATKTTSVGVLEIEKGVGKQKVGEAFGNAIYSGIPTSTAPPVIGFGSSATSSQSNGSLHLSSLASPATDDPAGMLSESRVSSTFSMSTANTSSMSRPSTTSTPPLISKVNLFQFGAASLAAPVSVSNLVKESNSTNFKTSVSITNTSSAPCKAASPETRSSFSSDLMKSSAFSSSDTSSSMPAPEVSWSITASSSALAPLSTFSSTGEAILISSATEQLTTSSYSSQNSTASLCVTASSSFGSQSTQSGSVISNVSQSSTGCVGLMTSAPSFGSCNPPSSGFGSSPIVSATSATNIFASSVPSFMSASLSSIPGTSFSIVPAAATSLFCSSSQTSTSLFGSSASSLSTGFSAGVSSASGSSSTGSMFSFTSSGTATSSTSPSPPVFTMPTPTSGFISGSPGNDQMNVEGSMADELNQATAHVLSSFSQPVNSIAAASPVFSSTVPSGGTAIFQFGSNQSPSVPQTLPFQGGSLGFPPTGSFNMGSRGGESGDKSGRRIFKPKRDKPRKR